MQYRTVRKTHDYDGTSSCMLKILHGRIQTIHSILIMCMYVVGSKLSLVGDASNIIYAPDIV